MITNARYTREADHDLIIVWDGVNDGHDSDLLNPARRQPDKSQGGPIRMASRFSLARDAVWEALSTEKRHAVTLRELVVLTGRTRAAVNSALHSLRLAGVLDSETLPTAMHYRSRPPQRYWRRA